MAKPYYLRAKQVSYSTSTRDRKSVTEIAIHYTGNVGDTARNNVKFFANGNTREAGAHLFVDSKEFCKSVPLNRTAWAVGNQYHNQVSVSIEICDLVTHDITEAQKKQLIAAIKYVKKYCPNVRNILRHNDVNGKLCPKRYCGSSENDIKWKRLKKELMQYI